MLGIPKKMASMLATQLSRHPSLKPLGLQTMYARHPSQTDPSTGRKFVPAVHEDAMRGYSIFMYPKTRFGYEDRILPDGRTIEYHPSTNASITHQLDRLIGKEVTLYVQTDRTQAREGRVVVEKPSESNVYHLQLRPQQHAAWADMD